MEQKYYQMSLDEKQKVAETLKEGLSSQREVLFAFIYGSFNDYTKNLPFHDIDVGVYVTKMDEKQSVYYSLDLSDRFSSLLKVPVDVRVLNFAPVTFCYHAIQGQLIVNKDDDLRSDFVERVIRIYLDMKPLLIRATKEAFGS